MDCHSGGTTSSIHHDCPQQMQVHHRMSPLELFHMKTSAPFMKDSSSNWMKSSSLTFFTSAATELVGCGNDESMWMVSSKSVDQSSRIEMAKFHAQARHHGSDHVSLFFTCQVLSSLFFLIESTMSTCLHGRMFCRYRWCHKVSRSTLAVNRH